MARYRIVEVVVDGKPKGYKLQHKTLFGWTYAYIWYGTFEPAKMECDRLNRPTPPPPLIIERVVHPYDETPAGKAHR